MSARILKASAVVTATTLFVGVLAGSSACTFGGLANYTIQACEPSKTQATDVCDRLNTDRESCTPYQCDPASRHCVQKTRDDDRDGDPSTKCGGTDCDDNDAARSGHATEICDQLDNNCNGLVDEDAITPGQERTIAPAGALSSTADPIMVPADDVGRDALAAFINANCVPFVALKPAAGGAVGAGCAVLGNELGLSPHQPYPIQIGTGNAAAFVATSACPTGYLSYRYQANDTAKLDMACDPQHPVALPSVVAMPLSANAQSGVITFYEANLAEHSNPVGDCTSVKPAPLGVLRVADLKTNATPTRANVLFSKETSVATRPAALLPIDAAHGILAASPLGSDVGLWLLTQAVLAGTELPAPTHIAALANAHATALASNVEGGVIHVALAAEIGCRPQASVQVVLGTLDGATGAVKVEGAPIDVSGAASVATAPSVAWIAGRHEWWVAWLDAKPNVIVRRVSPDGKTIGGPIATGKELPLGLVSSGESVFGFDPAASNGSFVEIPLSCAR